MVDDESREQLLRELGERWMKEREERDEEQRRRKQEQPEDKTSTTENIEIKRYKLLLVAFWSCRVILLLSLIVFLGSLGSCLYFRKSLGAIAIFFHCVVPSGLALFVITAINLRFKKPKIK